MVVVAVCVVQTIAIVVVRTQPEEGGTHVFGELTGNGDTGTVGVEHGHRHGEGRNTEGLETHTDFGVGLGDNPVNIAVTDLHVLAVVAQSSARLAVAPVLMADFEEHDALQGFGRDHVDLGTQTGGGAEEVGVLVGGSGMVGPRQVVLPNALGLDISSLRTSSRAEHEAGSKKQSHDALHLYSFLLSLMKFPNQKTGQSCVQVSFLIPLNQNQAIL